MVNIWTQLHFAAAVLYLAVGLYTYLQDRTSGTNRLFLILSAFFMIWAYANGLAISAKTEAEVWRIFSFFAPFWFVFPALLLHFTLHLTRSPLPRPHLILSLVYLPGILLYLFSSGGTTLIDAFPSLSVGRYILYNYASPYYYLHIGYYSLYVLFTIALYIRWYRSTDNPRRRKQALFICISLIAGAALSSVFGTLFPLLREHILPPIAPLCMLIWILGMSIAIVKYRLMRITPNFAAATIMRYIRDYVVLCDESEYVVHINQQVATHFASPASVKGKRAGDVFPFADTEHLSAFLGEADVRERRAQLCGTLTVNIPVHLTVMRMRDDTEREIGFVLVAHDLRMLRQLEQEKEEHRKTSEQLMRSQETFSKAFHASPVGMAIIDTASSSIEQLNNAAERILKYEDAENCTLPETPSPSALAWVSTEQQNAFFHRIEQHGRVYGMKSELYRCDGSTVEMLISADKIHVAGEEKLLFCFSDLSRVNRLERELVTMQKFESIGLLAGGIAHDFNNLLTAIMGNISLARESTRDEQTELRESLDLAQSACNHATQLTGQLLTFSKSDIKRATPVTIHEVVKQSVDLSLSGTDIATSVDIDAQLRVRADRGELVQVFNNLLINAKQALNGSGEITITARHYPLFEESRYAANAPLSLEKGNYVQVAVSDTGPGIPHSRIPHLFDPYYTSKSSGSGLGLSIVYSLVKKYGGDITVQSQTGIGSTFTLFLPAVSGNNSEEQPKEERRYRFTATVLLMDDETTIRKVGSQLLAQMGCTVYTDPEGEALLERVRNMKNRGLVPEAVILDLTVPSGMNGPSTAARLRTLLPAVPLILTTGHTEHEVLQDYASYGFSDYIIKPFTREQLAETLSRHIPPDAPEHYPLFQGSE